MDNLKYMKDTLMHEVQSQMGNLSQVDTKEMGEVIDMIKDLSEAIYYCTVTEAMEAKDKEQEKTVYYYTEPGMRPMDMERRRTYDDGRMYYDGGRMYYGGNGNSGGNSGNSNYYTEYPMENIHDVREGRSPMTRKTYMEGKMTKSKEAQMKELEKYVQELGQDITEMIKDATPEEKTLLQQKIGVLATKIK